MTLQAMFNSQLRPALWALRTRRDTAALSAVMQGLMGSRCPEGSNKEHLQATLGWLCAAQDALPDGGVSAFYDVRSGAWAPPYPETTGYIIPTFFDFAEYSGDPAYKTRAVRMADWLLTLQLESGAFPIGPLWPDWEPAPVVFDTGQIVHGLVRAFEETGDDRYRRAAARAGDWLADIQEADGSLTKFTTLGMLHVYNVRTAWGLVRLGQAAGSDRHTEAGARNLEWALTRQMPDGWFQNAEFHPGEFPLTHTIAYTIEGLLEGGRLLNRTHLIEAARLAADALRRKQAENGWLQARYGPGWQSPTRWSCLTGDAQMAWIWLRLHEMTGDAGYVEAADAAHRYLKERQRRGNPKASGVGGIFGSFPVHEEYEPFRQLNWAAKFFADSLLLDERRRSTRAGG